MSKYNRTRKPRKRKSNTKRLSLHPRKKSYKVKMNISRNKRNYKVKRTKKTKNYKKKIGGSQSTDKNDIKKSTPNIINKLPKISFC